MFGIGLNKTGTTSLAEALRVLGWCPIHRETSLHGAHKIRRSVDEALDRGQRPFAGIPQLERDFNAYFDMRSVERHFPAFDVAYPGSRFILHTRDLDGWLSSRLHHVRRNVHEGRESRWTHIDESAWTEEWHAHHERVRTYFRDRSDLLTIDVTAGQGWEALAPFLDVQVPSRPFPERNSASRDSRVKWRTVFRRRD